MSAQKPSPDSDTTLGKRYFTIGEVAGMLDVKPHVLRHWEREVPQLNPTKRAGNRRYYTPENIEIARRIHHLVRERGVTLSGARAELAGKSAASEPDPFVNGMIRQLQDLLRTLRG